MAHTEASREMEGAGSIVRLKTPMSGELSSREVFND